MEKTIKTIEDFLLTQGKKEFKIGDFLAPIKKVKDRKATLTIGFLLAKRVRLWTLKKQYSPVYLGYVNEKNKLIPISDISKKSDFFVFVEATKLKEIIERKKFKKFVLYIRNYDKDKKLNTTFYAESLDGKVFKFADKIEKKKANKKEDTKEKELKSKILEYKKMFE